MNRYQRKYKGRRQKTEVRGQGSEVGASEIRASDVEGPRVVAVGKIHKGVRETYVTVQCMSPLGAGAALRVFGPNTARAEEIANL